MDLNFSLKPESVAIVSAGSKDEILGSLAQIFGSAWELDRDMVLENLDEREKLGSTGFGRGVAIPHARIPGIRRPIAAMLKLEKPVSFDAADGLPVDLVIGLLSPENCGAAHLHALAALSRMVRDERMHDALSDAPDAEALYGIITNVTDRDAA
ncbi:PTS sugar transporter subunit IIA [Aurantiacibacter marinus]|uniref:PTS IIA-like nitrogen-regulatory protein PtsN n=1 Tax=Aurantiacibacter marinus TaxID=874156 RepID=A0A0H0XRI1_9SPHN|nr:PTS sugar transporter subunit IIA [Aurantiacibacter marinus]KLI65233.1 PTS IIA-like nitrogen-regulatory protein PtsN [Aurantiacibacter marinus]